MLTRHEGFIHGYQDLNLFFQTWEKPGAKGTLLITHGQGEHSECYHRLVDAFKNDQWNFWAWDMRGHGRSEGKRGYAAHFDDYCRDYLLILQTFMANDLVKKTGPIVLLSHSMGGLVQLKTLIDQPDLNVAAQVCSAPLLGVGVPVPAIKDAGAKLLNSLLPQITLWNEIKNEYLTRDPDVVREFEQDVLRHNRISPGVYLGFLDTFNYVHSRAEKIKTPTLFQCPEQDPVVSTAKAQEFFAHLKMQDKQMLTYGDGARHEMYNDLHREIVYADLKKFLDHYLR